jgi:NAD(P)-dependent dehydrogenase (short-subunit alcohol dehydrogenase family)
MAAFDLSGKLVLITGGARGIGRCTASKLASEGAKVLIADLDGGLAQETAKEVVLAGAYPLDVADGPAFRALVERIEAEHGPLEVLINNAGVMSLGGFTEQASRNDEKQVAVNLFGVINGMRAVLPRMKKRGRGRIVNVASQAGKIGVPGAAVYSATKHAICGLTESVRLEYRGSGIRFSYVLPAPVRTELYAGAKELKFPPLVEPEEVADAILDAVVRGKLEVYVPKIGKLLSILPAILPLKVRDRIGDLLGLGTMFVKYDPEKRKEYVARTFER